LLLSRLTQTCALVQETKVICMSRIAPSPAALRVADLSQNSETAFGLTPKPSEMADLAAALDLSGLRKLRFEGTVRAFGATDWVLKARLGASITQPCSVTLEPVTTRIDVDVRRLFVRDFVEIDAPEAEMPEDDTVEPLTQWIDPHAVMIEALSLEIPEFPRSEGASLGETVLTEPGAEPLRDADLKPFAGLSGLRDQLKNEDDT